MRVSNRAVGSLLVALTLAAASACGSSGGGGLHDDGADGGAEADGSPARNGAAGPRSDGAAPDEPPGCRNSLDCVDAPGGRNVCDPAFERCVECVQSADCPPEHDCARSACVAFTPCTNSLDCPEHQVCDTARERCVQCIRDADCEEDQVCAGSACRQACQSDRQCTPLGQLCDTARGHCAECLRDADCGDRRYCTEGACWEVLCDPGSARCRDGAVVRCSDRGDALLPAQPCSARQTCQVSGDSAACESWVCTAGETECEGNRDVITCSDNGLFVVDRTDCSLSDRFCSQGACTDGLCPAGERYCEGQEMRQCNAEATDFSVVGTCTASQYCDPADGSCKTLVCSPGAAGCDDNSPATCNALGSGFTSVGSPCPGGEYCTAGECDTFVLREDFESGDAAGWSAYTGGFASATYQTVTSTAANGTTTSLEIVATATVLPNYAAGVTLAFTEAPVAAASFWVRAPSTTAGLTSFVLLSGTSAVMSVGLSSTGLFRIGSTSTATAYVANQWYHVELRNVDWGERTYEIYVDDAFIGQGTMTGTATEVDRVRLTGAPSGASMTIFFDEILIG